MRRPRRWRSRSRGRWSRSSATSGTTRSTRGSRRGPSTGCSTSSGHPGRCSTPTSSPPSRTRSPTPTRCSASPSRCSRCAGSASPPSASSTSRCCSAFATSAASGYLFGRVGHAARSSSARSPRAAFAFGPFGSVSSGALHATAHAGVGVAAAAAWWLADRAESPTTPACSRRAALLAAALVWQASVSFYPGAYAFGAAVVDPRGALAFARAARLAVGGRRARWSPALCTLAMAIPYLQVRDEQPGFHRTLADLPPLERRLRRHRPAPLDLGFAARQGRRLADLRRAGVPGSVPARARADRRDRRVARTRARRRRASIAGRRAGARRRSRSASAPGPTGLASVRAVPAAVRVRARVGGAARHRPRVGRRPARRGRARRPRRAGRSAAGSHGGSTGAPARSSAWSPRSRCSACSSRATRRGRGRPRPSRACPPSTSSSPTLPAGGVLYLPALEPGAAPPRGVQRLPPGRERLRHHRAPPQHAERLLRLLPAVVGAALARDGIAARRRRRSTASAHSASATSWCATGPQGGAWDAAARPGASAPIASRRALRWRPALRGPAPATPAGAPRIP